MKIKVGVIFSILAVIVVILIILFTISYLGHREVKEQNTDNIKIEGNTIYLDSLNLRQKLSQMIMVRGDKKDLLFNNLNVGGVFLDRQTHEEKYKRLIEDYQDTAKIKLLVATDLEGAWNPFKENKPHQQFPYFSKINDSGEAYEVGLKHGELLKQVGFNLNLAPVAEYYDDVYGGRAFSGTKQEIKEKIAGYIRGLQENVPGTCKHYPGKSMEKNLHIVTDTQTISEEDLELFETCIENDISAMMVSHQIAKGVLDSNEKPSTVSKEVISNIDSSVLIIADEINMWGLKEFYPEKNELYIDLINSGGEFILDFYLNTYELHKLLLELEKEVEQGKIETTKIEDSVRKILEFKGYEVI
jgi:beta-N-acetylhexosaminidase